MADYLDTFLEQSAGRKKKESQQGDYLERFLTASPAAPPEFLPEIEPPSRMQRLAMGPVGAGAEFLGSALSRLAPFPGLIEAIQTGDKENIMSQIAQVFPRAVEDTFQGTVENVKKYISPAAGKAIEDLMANYPVWQGMRLQIPPTGFRGFRGRGKFVDPRTELKRIFQKRASGEILTPEEQAVFTRETGIAPEPPKLLEGPKPEFPRRELIPEEKPPVTGKVARETLEAEEIPTYRPTETRPTEPPTLEIPTQAEVAAREIRQKFLGENKVTPTDAEYIALKERAEVKSVYPVEIKKAAGDVIESLEPKPEPKLIRQTPGDVADTVRAIEESQSIEEAQAIGKATKHAGIRKATREKVRALKSAPQAPILFEEKGLPPEVAPREVEPPPVPPVARPAVSEQKIREMTDEAMARGRYAGFPREQVEFMVRRALRAPPKPPEYLGEPLPTTQAPQIAAKPKALGPLDMTREEYVESERGKADFAGKNPEQAANKAGKRWDTLKAKEPPEAPELEQTPKSPVFETTEAGQQALIPGTEARTVPQGRLKAKAAQAQEPTLLEQGGLEPPAPELFGEGKVKETPRPYGGGPPKPPELKAESPADTLSADRFRQFPKDYPERAEKSPRGGYEYASTDELLALSKTAKSPEELTQIGRVIREKIDQQGWSDPLSDQIRDITEPYVKPIEMGKTILKSLVGTLKDDKGMAVFPFKPGNFNIPENFDAFVDHLGTLLQAGKDFNKVELKNLSKRFWKQFRVGQFYAARNPQYRAIYEEVHKFDWKPTSDSQADIGRFPALADYFRLPKKRARIVNEALIETREARTRLTEERLTARGLTPDEQLMYGRILEYGNYRLDKWIDFHAERIARAEAARRAAQAGDPALDLGEVPGQISPELIAWAREQAAARISDLRDVYVPFSRFGKKTITVKDFTGEVVDFRLAETGFQRAGVVKELERTIYPRAQGFRIEIGELREAVGKGLLQDIDMGTLEILSRFADVAPETAAAFLAEVAPYLAKRGAQARFVKASEMPGFERDLKRGIIQMTESQNRYMERLRTRDNVNDLIKALPEDAYEMRQFAKEEMENVLGGAKETHPAVRGLRNFTYISFLGGQLRQTAVQMSILPINVYPRLGEFSKTPFRDLMGGITDSFRGFERLNIQEQDAIDQGFRRGVLRPRIEPFFGDLEPFTPRTPFTEVGGTMEHAKMAGSPMKRYGDYLRRILMYPVFLGDFKARQASALAFYRVGRRNGMSHEAAIDFMEKETNFTNHTFDAANRPRVFRGNVGEMVGVMRHFLVNELNLWRALLDMGSYKTLTKSVAIMLGLSGTVGVPGWDILRSVWNLLGEDPEERARAWLKDWQMPGWLADFTLHGLPGLAGIDLSRSLGMGDIIPADVFRGRLAGIAVPLDLVERGGRAVSLSLKKLDAFTGRSPTGPTWIELADAWMPLQAAKNPLAGYRLSQYGVTTPSGDKIGDVGPVAPVLRGLGLNPMEEARLRGAHRALQIEERKLRDDKSGATRQMAKALLDNDLERQQEIQNNIAAYNAKAPAHRQFQLDVREVLEKYYAMKYPQEQLKKVPKQLRQRVPELSEEYQAPLYGFPPQ